MYDIYKECEKINSLKNVYVPHCCEGGFAWPPTDASLHQWNSVINRRREPDMTVLRQLRTIRPHICVNDWKNLPNEPDFDVAVSLIDRHGSFCRGLQTLKSVEFYAKCGPSLGMIIDFINILLEQGHLLLETRGFKYNINTGCVKIAKKTKTQYITVDDMKTLKSSYPKSQMDEE